MKLKKVDDKVKKNSIDILSFKSSLGQEKFTIDDFEREVSFSRGFYYYTQQSLNHLVEMVELLIVGYQQEFIMTVTILICFL